MLSILIKILSALAAPIVNILTKSDKTDKVQVDVQEGVDAVSNALGNVLEKDAQESTDASTTDTDIKTSRVSAIKAAIADAVKNGIATARENKKTTIIVCATVFLILYNPLIVPCVLTHFGYVLPAIDPAVVANIISTLFSA